MTNFFNLMINIKMTLEELYEEKRKQLNPAQELIKTIMAATGRSELSVRLWVTGKHRPERLVQEKIAEVLNMNVETLFPKNVTNYEK